jgi:hypothetical protein
MLKVRKRRTPFRVSRQNLQYCYLKTHATPRHRDQICGEANGRRNFGPSAAAKRPEFIADFSQERQIRNMLGAV